MQKRVRYVLVGLIIPLILYWLYLAFVTQPIMVQDAKGYADLGRMIAEKGWKEYFLSGPNREPVYPFFLATTILVAGQSFFLFVLKYLQIIILFLTVVTTFVTLRRFGVTLGIAIVAVGYLGFSPSMVNSALSVYSEIAAYLFILGIVAFSAKAYLKLQNGRSAWRWGVALALCFVMATLVKSIYEIMFYIVLIPFLAILWKQKDRKIMKACWLFLLVILVIFHGAIGGYKYLNKKYNGLFVLTDRAAWAFYGTAARRQVPLTADGFGVAVTAKILEKEGCQLFYSAAECWAWDVTTADKFSAEKNYEVIAKFPSQQQNKELLKASLIKIMENPWQYGVLMVLDGIRMFFWESTNIGFVAYPDWLDRVWNQPVFANSLRLLVGFLSLGAFLFCFIHLYRERKSICSSMQGLMFFAVYIVFWHVALYALFFTIPRFALPIAPLLILLMALSVQILIQKGEKRHG